MGKVKKEKDLVKEYGSVKACLDAGYTWEQCVNVRIKDDGKLHGYITRACPRPMKAAILDAVISGEPINFSEETEEKEKKKE